MPGPDVYTPRGAPRPPIENIKKVSKQTEHEKEEEDWNSFFIFLFFRE